MATIYGMSNYNNLFTSPFKNYEVNPVTNLLYGATAGRIYSQTAAKKLQSSMSSYLSSLNSNANTLKTNAKALASKGATSSFDQKTVSSADNTAISGTASPTADMKEYTLNVSKLAVSQVNTGTALTSNGKTFNQGINTFSVKVGNKDSKNISISIDENDSNKSNLDKMAKAVNYAKLGVTASVVEDSKAGTSYLKITSDKTGTDNSFSITDITGNAAAVSGAGTVSTQTQNAEYVLDGKNYTSQENNINIDNGKVNLTLKKAENKDIKVSIGYDSKAIKEDIKDFVDSYNSMVSFVSSNSTTFKGASTLSNELDSIVSSRKNSLQNIGINVNSDGTLSIDDKKLDNALSGNLPRVKDVMGGYNGVASKVYEKSTEVLSSPMKYSSVNVSSGNFTNYYKNMTASSRSMFMQNLYSGLLFDASL